MNNSNLHLTLAAELSCRELTYAKTSETILNKVNDVLNRLSNELGKVLSIEVNKRTVGQIDFVR